MKKVLKVVIQYFSMILISALLGIILFSLFDSSSRLVAGSSLSFNGDAVVKGFFIGIHVSLMLSGLYLSCLRLSENKSRVSVFITYIVIGLFTWLLFMPLMLKCSELASGNGNNGTFESTPLSSGYFRDNGGKSFYFASEEKDEKAKVIGVDKNAVSFETAVYGEIDLSSDSDFVKNTYPFSDPLIKESYSDFPFSIFEIFGKILESGKKAVNSGFLGWLCFAAFGFALFSVYGFILFSSWKMIDIFLVSFLTCVIVGFNSIFYTEAFSFLHNVIDVSGEITGAEIMLAIINCVMAVLMIGSSVTIFSLRRRKSR